MNVSFRAKLLASHAVVALLVGAVTLVVVERQVSRRMEQQVDARLAAQARAVARWIERAAHPQQLARRLAGVVDARVTILDHLGVVVGESEDAAATPGPELEDDATEVREARAGFVGRETRYSARAGEPVRYVAVATDDAEVVRLGVPIGEITETKQGLRRQLIVAAFVSALAALGLAIAVAGPLTRRLRDATTMARRIGAGEYQLLSPSAAGDEIGVLSRALATAGSELRATEQRRREFLADVAHELRTPVTSIRGYADILSRGPVDAETGKEFLQTIHRNAIRIGTLVEDLLELEALEAGKGPALAHELVTLAPVVGHVADTLRARVAEREATIAIAIDAAATMQGDAAAIELIVLNLADNAVRHGGVGVKVTIAATLEGDRARLTISDDGAGIPVEHRARIFERFQRGAAQRGGGNGGSGLGLAIARELAIAMGGSLVLTGGSTFTLELPA